MGPTFELYVVENPEPGDWTVDLFGADVSPDGEEVGLFVEQTAPLNEIPVGSVTLLQQGSTITVSAAGSADSDGSIVGYEWDFGDGTTADGADTSHAYTQAGEYQVTLIVTDDAGSLGFASSSIIKIGFNFEGFRAPVDNPPIVNTANAGRVIPLKWRLTDLDGVPVSDPASPPRSGQPLPARRVGPPAGLVHRQHGPHRRRRHLLSDTLVEHAVTSWRH